MRCWPESCLARSILVVKEVQRATVGHVLLTLVDDREVKQLPGVLGERFG